MEYLILAVLVALGWFALVHRLRRGWRERHVAENVRTSTEKVLAGVFAVVFLALAYGLNNFTSSWSERQAASQAQERIAKQKAEADARLADLNANRSALLQRVSEMRAAGKIIEARDEANKYMNTDDAEIKALVNSLNADISAQSKKERIAELESAIKGYDPTWAQRLLSDYRELTGLAPQEKRYKEKVAYYEKLVAADAARIERANKAAKKREGVRIGMSKQDVLDSSWGKPSSVNTTSNRYGTHEQWVYDRYHNGYLYFDNDILTSISN